MKSQKQTNTKKWLSKLTVWDQKRKGPAGEKYPAKKGLKMVKKIKTELKKRLAQVLRHGLAKAR